MSYNSHRTKKEKILKSVKSILDKKYCTIQEIAELTGTLVFACQATEYGFLYTKSLGRAKIRALRNCNFDYSQIMMIPTYVFEELEWWKKSITHAVKPIRKGEFDLCIYTDASDTGWGATDGVREIFGFWFNCELKQYKL